MSDPSPLLMRAIARELTERIIPELHSADAIERAVFARLVLQHLATDCDVVPGVSAGFVPGYRQVIAAALDDGARTLGAAAVARYRQALAAIAAGSGARGIQDETAALRELLSRLLRDLADAPAAGGAAGSALFGSLKAMGALDCSWLDRVEAARAAASAPARSAAATDSTPAAAASAGTPEPSIESLTRYLRGAIKDAPAVAVTELVPIPGGRSKKTFFVTLTGTQALPAELVMRQDFALKYAGTCVRDEYVPLHKLSALGLPVPRPVHLSAEPSEAGPPFILVERVRGKPPGTYFGMQGTCPGAFRDLARTLARLHQVPPAELGITAPAGAVDHMVALIDQYQRKWRENATRASPLVDYAYAWARHECAIGECTTAYVHGDAGPYNFLVDNDRLTALLDWEFGHLGDPGEDLGVARLYAESSIPWAEFLQIYTDAGGPRVPERRIQLGMLIQFLKGTTLVAASGRNFQEGGTAEFTKGANSFTGLRLIEQRIAELLQRFGAV